MKIAVLGTGVVGQTIAGKLISLGYNVMMGSRTSHSEKAGAWVQSAGANASQGSFAEAAAFGELIFNCTQGVSSLEALKMAGAKNLDGKILIDVSNPLDFSKGMPPTLTVCNDNSLGEQIQQEFPACKVVKTLNTVNCRIMVNPAILPGQHDVFMSGNDAGAKKQVLSILKDWFGWKNVIDLGDITTARGTEMLLPLWVRLYGTFGSPDFNFHLVRS